MTRSGFITSTRVLSPDSPTRPRPEKRLSRLTGLRGGRGGPVVRHPLRGCETASSRQPPSQIETDDCRLMTDDYRNSA